jgi:hypothetical protein
MKRFITCLLLSFLVIAAAQAQSNLTTSTYGNTRDTVTNTAVKVWSKQLPGFSIQTFTFDVTKISGTVAGNVIPVGSLDGVNYYNISTDTLKLTDVAAQGKAWSITNTKFLYYGVRWTGSGTSSASGAGKIVGGN